MAFLKSINSPLILLTNSSFLTFSSSIISFINSCWNFNLDFFSLFGSFATFVASSGVGSRVGILSILLEIICF